MPIVPHSWYHQCSRLNTITGEYFYLTQFFNKFSRVKTKPLFVILCFRSYNFGYEWQNYLWWCHLWLYQLGSNTSTVLKRLMDELHIYLLSLILNTGKLTVHKFRERGFRYQNLFDVTNLNLFRYNIFRRGNIISAYI